MINILNTDKGAVQIRYEGTNLMKVSYALSLIGIIALVAYVVYLNKLKNSVYIP